MPAPSKKAQRHFKKADNAHRMPPSKKSQESLRTEYHTVKKSNPRKSLGVAKPGELPFPADDCGFSAIISIPVPETTLSSGLVSRFTIERAKLRDVESTMIEVTPEKEKTMQVDILSDHPIIHPVIQAEGFEFDDREDLDNDQNPDEEWQNTIKESGLMLPTASQIVNAYLEIVQNQPGLWLITPETLDSFATILGDEHHEFFVSRERLRKIFVPSHVLILGSLEAEPNGNASKQVEHVKADINISRRHRYHVKFEIQMQLKYLDISQPGQSVHQFKWVWMVGNEDPKKPSNNQYGQAFEAKDVSTHEWVPLLRSIFPTLDEAFFRGIQDSICQNERLWLFPVQTFGHFFSSNMDTSNLSGVASAKLKTIQDSLTRPGTAYFLVQISTDLNEALRYCSKGELEPCPWL